MVDFLITGASGLIGSTLTAKLSEYGNIIALSRKNKESEFKNVKYLMFNLNDFSSHVFPEKAETIIHLAQTENFRDFPNSSEEIFNVNTLSTLKLLEYARKVKTKNFILASSGGVYGSGSKTFTENDSVSLNKELGFYFGSKICSEILAENYSDFMNIIILRFFFVYGENQNKSMLIPRLISSIIKSKEITLVGQEGIKINPIYVLDAVNAIIKSIELGKSLKVNIAGDEVLSLKNIALSIGRAFNKEPIFFIKNQVEEKNLIGDISLMKQVIYTPKISFSEGINRIKNSALIFLNHA